MDFAAILVLATAGSGFIWGVDALWFAPRRRAVTGEPAKEPMLVDYARSFFPVLLIVLLLRSFLTEPFRIPSGSMMPTLLTGDFILVNKFAYGLRWPVLNSKFLEIGAPERGDVAVFRYPGMNERDPHRGQDYIKRVVGLPGDHIAYRNKALYVNGQSARLAGPRPYVGEPANFTGKPLDIYRERLGSHEFDTLLQPPLEDGLGGEITVPPGHFFVMGDNRDNSSDSRIWGLLPEENLVGRAYFIWMSLSCDTGTLCVRWGRIGSKIP